MQKEVLTSAEPPVGRTECGHKVLLGWAGARKWHKKVELPSRTRALLGHISLVSDWTLMILPGTSKGEVSA